MRPSLAFLAMFAPAAIAAGSCALRGFTVDDRSSSSGSGGGDAGGKCGVTFPDPPAKAVPGGAEEFTVAVHSVNLGDMGTVGLDLDLRCTCHGDGPSCQSPTTPPEICDDNEGRDNEWSVLLSKLTLALGSSNFGSSFYSTKAHEGFWSLLLRVRGYNGQVNDAQVEVSWYGSPGFKTNAFADASVVPSWDGNDEWNVSGASVLNMDLEQPKYRDMNAYVSDSMLVATLPEVDLVFAGGGGNTMTLHLTGAGVLAKIEQDPVLTTYKLTQGQLVGRWRAPDVFAALGSYRDNAGMGLCKTNVFYGAGKGILCNSRDILAGQGTPATPCDSISVGIGFKADAAQLPKPDGGILPPPAPSPSPCPDGGDPTMDTCPP